MELFTPSFGLVFWMFVSFAILFLILWKFAWPMILDTVDKRADLIDKGVEYARQAQTQLENADKEAQNIISDARRREADIMREADAMRTKIVEDARSEAKTEASKEKDAAKLAIEQSRREAERNLRAQIGNLAVDIASKVVAKNLGNDNAQAALVNSMLDDLEKNN